MSKVYEYYLEQKLNQLENPEPDYVQYDECNCQQCTSQDEALKATSND